ncbi:MAG: hypothetical protein ACRC5H_09140, partial [Treponemataceae bacterium]
FDDEKIKNIDALFQWGKVQRGMKIFFSLSGEKPKNIAKLKKILTQAASRDFESFLSDNIIKNLWL